MTDIICKFCDAVIELMMFIRPQTLIGDDILLNITTYAGYALDLLKKVNFLVPIPVIYMVLMAMISIKISMFLIWMVNWVINRVFDVIP